MPIGGALPTSKLATTSLAAIKEAVRDQQLIEPHEIQAQLLAQPEVKRAVAFAESRAARSEASFLKLERRSAVAAARESLGRLRLTAGRFHSPRLVVRAEVALALALLLDPPAPDFAARALAEAVAIDPGLMPDRDRFAPRARKLLAKVKAEPRPVAEPELPELRAVARLAGVSRLLWIAVGKEEQGNVPIKLVVFHRDKGQIVLRLQQPMKRARLRQEMIAAVKHALSTASLPAAAPPSTTPALAAAPTEEEGKPMARPWYRRWWVWALVATAVAGGITAIAVASSSSPSGLTIHFDL